MTSLSFTVPGRPVSLNSAYEPRHNGTGGLTLSVEAHAYKHRVQAAAVGALGSARCPFKGNVLLVVVPHFTREADAGACAKFVADALEGIAYRNDSAVLLSAQWKGEPDPKNPWTDVMLREIANEELELGTFAVEVPRDIAQRVRFSRLAADAERDIPRAATAELKRRERAAKAKPTPSVRRFR